MALFELDDDEIRKSNLCVKCLQERVAHMEKALKSKEEQIALFRQLIKELNQECDELKERCSANINVPKEGEESGLRDL